MFFNFNDDSEVVPISYSIKGYRKGESTLFKKFFKYFFYILIVLMVGIIPVLFYVR